MRFRLSLRARRIVAVLAVAALPCFAGEVAVLKNGFSIRHERREIVGDVTRLYVSADGSSFVDVPTAEIDILRRRRSCRLRTSLTFRQQCKGAGCGTSRAIAWQIVAGFPARP